MLRLESIDICDEEERGVFCYQCEQTYRSDEGAGCAGAKGMCGKDATTADLQDILLYVCERVGQYLHRARQLGAGASPLVEPNRDKATVIALREIASGKVGTEVLKRNATPPTPPGL